MSFPPYASYKDSGVEWLGAVPSHWRVEPLKRLAAVMPSNVDKKTHEGETPVRLCNYTDVYYSETISDAVSLMESSASAEQIDRFSLRSGDVILTKDSETADDIAISAYVPADLPGVVCGYHLALVRPDPSAASGAFLKRYFDGAFAKANVAVRANGLTRVGLGQYALDNLHVPTPPVEEQAGIANFLDRETAKIDALVEAQRRLIALLKEKRQAVISHAVTKGLDPSAPLKPSGIPWLGDIPAHWDVKALKWIVRMQSGEAITSDDIEDAGSFPVFGGNGLRGYAGEFTHEGNYILIGRQGALCGNVNYASGRFWASEHALVAHPRTYFDVLWLGELLRLMNLGQYSTSAAQPGVAAEVLGNLRCPMPPQREQTNITNFIRQMQSKIDPLLSESERTIALLPERRAALISAAVTGKIDVRGWTAEQVRDAVGAEIVHLHARDHTFGRVQNQKLLFLAQAHAGVDEIGGRFQRKAAGPHDAELMLTIEEALTVQGVLHVSQPGGPGSQVTYTVTSGTRPDRARLRAMLGAERLAKLDHLLKVLADEDTRGVEAVATLYGVWNDALLDGETPDDGRLIRGFMDWHPEKAIKFKADDVPNRIGFMRRNGLVPEGRGSRTQVGALL